MLRLNLGLAKGRRSQNFTLPQDTSLIVRRQVFIGLKRRLRADGYIVFIRKNFKVLHVKIPTDVVDESVSFLTKLANWFNLLFRGAK